MYSKSKSDRCKINICLIVLTAYLAYLFLTVPRISYRVAYENFLWDYHYGVTRRALEGSLFSLFHKSQFTDIYFIYLINSMQILALLFFFIISYIVLRKRFSLGIFTLLLIIASSPNVFKNQIHDIGRQDILGFMLLEVTAILSLLNLPRLALVLFSTMIIPLSLVADNNVLFWGPACLSVVIFSYDLYLNIFIKNNDVKIHGSVLTFKVPIYWVSAIAAFGISLLLPFLLARPSVDEASYRNYLQSKSVNSIYFPGNTGYPTSALYLTTNINDNSTKSYWATHKRVVYEFLPNLIDFIFFLVPTLLLLLFIYNMLDSNVPYIGYILLISLISITIFALPGYFIGWDYARYYSNYIAATDIVLLVFIINKTTISNFGHNYINIIVCMIYIYINKPFGIFSGDFTDITNFVTHVIKSFKGEYFINVR